MKPVLYILCVLILSSTHTFAADLSAEDKEVLEIVAAYPDLAVELGLAYPHLALEIRDTAVANSGKLRTRKKINDINFKTKITKGRNWEGYECGQEDLRSETKTEWPNQCSKWFTEDSDNPATTNSAQNEANGYESARREGLITYQAAMEGTDNLAADGSQFVNPLPPESSSGF